MATVAQRNREVAIKAAVEAAALVEDCSKAIDAIYNHISNDPLKDRYSIDLDVPYTVKLQKEVEHLLCDAEINVADMFETVLAATAQRNQAATVEVANICASFVDAVYDQISAAKLADVYVIKKDVGQIKNTLNLAFLQQQIRCVLLAAGWKVLLLELDDEDGLDPNHTVHARLEWPSEFSVHVHSEIDNARYP
ncbi:hypothetical protein HDU88_004868 [Geranomyces variabilis]|nr:hypothetical protein HDU88_004868 [Geranomyces variabilis]